MNDDHDPLCLFARQSEAMGVQTPRLADECLTCRQCRIARDAITADLRTAVEALTDDSQTMTSFGVGYDRAVRDVLALIDGRTE